MRKNSSKLLAAIGILLVITGVAIFLKGGDASQNDAQLTPIKLVSSDGKTADLKVEIADNSDERQHGLMGRMALDEKEGMLFVFEDTQPLFFWMKNTLIPLDILFFDDQGMFVSRASMEPCKTENCPSYGSGGAAKYALEVNENEAETGGVGQGWKLVLE